MRIRQFDRYLKRYQHFSTTWTQGGTLRPSCFSIVRVRIGSTSYIQSVCNGTMRLRRCKAKPPSTIKSSKENSVQYSSYKWRGTRGDVVVKTDCCQDSRNVTPEPSIIHALRPPTQNKHSTRSPQVTTDRRPRQQVAQLFCNHMMAFPTFIAESRSKIGHSMDDDDSAELPPAKFRFEPHAEVRIPPEVCASRARMQFSRG
jgi:hypothetical protein